MLNPPNRRGTDPHARGVGGVALRDVPLSRLTRAQPRTRPKKLILSGYSGGNYKAKPLSCPPLQVAGARIRGFLSSICFRLCRAKQGARPS